MVKTCKGTVIMRKGIDESKVQRMRNIVSGDYSKRVNIRSGYTTKRIKRVEGDVWEEKGKTWTIKNGLKQTVNNLDEIRKKNAIPLCCPSCEKKMKWFDTHAYRMFNFCSNCLSVFETNIKKNGKEAWKSYKKEVQDKNFKSWLEERVEEFKDFISQRNSKTMISEAGDIEDWSSGQSEEELKAIFEKQIKEIQERRNEKSKI